MPLELQEPFAAVVPESTIVGVVGIKGSGKGALLRSIVDRTPGARLIALGEQLNFAPAPVLALDAALACQDALLKARAALSIEQMRRQGSIVFLVSHDEPLLLRLADEIWWLNDGRLAAKGDPREVLSAYRAFIASRMVEWGRTLTPPLDISSRRGDRLAEILSLETLDFAGAPTGILKSGEDAAIRVTIKFNDAVPAPVVGIMIRTRVGFEVYGTNTELEGAKLPPQSAGASLRLEFRFGCNLCPGDYTVTAACHDPDGSAHDWLDDAIAFSVADSRYTAGVANLRSRVEIL